MHRKLPYLLILCFGCAIDTVPLPEDNPDKQAAPGSIDDTDNECPWSSCENSPPTDGGGGCNDDCCCEPTGNWAEILAQDVYWAPASAGVLVLGPPQAELIGLCLTIGVPAREVSDTLQGNNDGSFADMLAAQIGDTITIASPASENALEIVLDEPTALSVELSQSLALEAIQLSIDGTEAIVHGDAELLPDGATILIANLSTGFARVVFVGADGFQTTLPSSTGQQLVFSVIADGSNVGGPTSVLRLP